MELPVFWALEHGGLFEHKILPSRPCKIAFLEVEVTELHDLALDGRRDVASEQYRFNSSVHSKVVRLSVEWRDKDEDESQEYESN